MRGSDETSTGTEKLAELGRRAKALATSDEPDKEAKLTALFRAALNTITLPRREDLEAYIWNIVGTSVSDKLVRRRIRQALGFEDIEES